MGRWTLCLALPTQRFFLYEWNSRPIHLPIQDRNRVTEHDRQVPLREPSCENLPCQPRLRGLEWRGWTLRAVRNRGAGFVI